MAIGVHNVCEAGNIVYGDRPCSVCGATSDESCRSIDVIQKRIDERADAARYKWIKENMKNMYGDEVLSIIGESGKAFDAAIDAAIASQKQGGAE